MKYLNSEAIDEQQSRVKYCIFTTTEYRKEATLLHEFPQAPNLPLTLPPSLPLPLFILSVVEEPQWQKEITTCSLRDKKGEH
jgi:hypothetical protein